jgi:hypothetical protein
MKQNIKNSARANGLIIGALLSFKFLLSVQNNSIVSMLAIAISILIIFVIYGLTIKFRESKCNGSIQFGEAFSYVFQVYLYGAIISSLIMLLYSQFVDKTLLEFQLNDILLVYKRFSLPVDDNTQKMLTLIYKPAPFALMNLLASAFTGAFWGLILAALVKKDKNIFDNEQ